MATIAIAKAYVRRINRGSITIDDVPESIVDEVKQLLAEAEAEKTEK